MLCAAVALCSAARALQRGVQAEIRNLCKPWGVQLTANNDNGTYVKRGDDVYLECSVSANPRPHRVLWTKDVSAFRTVFRRL